MRFIYILVIVLLVSACMSKVAIEIEKADKQVVVNSILCTADTATVSVSFTYPSFGESLIEVPLVDKVFINSDANTFELTPSSESNGRVLYKGNFLPQPGINYQLTVELDDGEKLTSLCAIPEAVEIDSFFLQNTIPEYESDQPIDLKIRFKDPSGQTNYYMVGFTIYKSNQLYYYDPDENFAEPEYGFVYKGYYFLSEVKVNLNINEPLIGNVEFNEPRILCFNDTKIDGNVYTLSIGIRDFFNDGLVEALLFVPKLYAINADTYLYYQSINKASENNESFIAEPIVQFSNITGGLGIMGGMALSTDTLMVMKDDVFKKPE